MSALRECPFCGWAAKVSNDRPMPDPGSDAICCTNKKCSASTYYIDRRDWNRRAAELDASGPREPERIAPVQGYAPGIPWSMHMEAYEAYAKKWAPQPALITGGCRGGFHVGELDEFIPGWRERLPRPPVASAPGFVLVPREPTIFMKQAALDALRANGIRTDNELWIADYCYRAMLAAAQENAP